MSSPFMFPVELGYPLRDSYGDSPEKAMSRTDMEVGVSRQRRTMRTAPRVFQISWVFTSEQYKVFHDWWCDTVLHGQRTFDIQLLDDYQTIKWVTAQWVDTYKAEVIDLISDNWRVSGSIRLKSDYFDVRNPGTDQLAGICLSETICQGAFGTTVLLYGISNPGASPTAVLGYEIFRGISSPDTFCFGTLYVPPPAVQSPANSRQWMILDWTGDIYSADINYLQQVKSREFMEM